MDSFFVNNPVIAEMKILHEYFCQRLQSPNYNRTDVKCGDLVAIKLGNKSL